MFKQGVPYSRLEIQKLLGGELQTYLPQKNWRILAGCLLKKMNPNAPEEIYVGNPQRVVRKALLLESQPENKIPVFIRPEHSKGYYFHGYFRCKDMRKDQKTIEEANKASGRNDIARVLYLEKT